MTARTDGRSREEQELLIREEQAFPKEAYSVPVVGVTGGIGSGKSAVLRFLREQCGASVLQTDELAKELMRPGTACYEALRKAFGNRILRPDGSIDTKRYGDLIYSDERLQTLSDSLVHPAVWEAVRQRIASGSTQKSGFQKEGRKGAGKLTDAAHNPAFWVVETALPGKELSRICSTIWYVHVPEELRIRRLMEGRSMSEEAVRRILRKQPQEAAYRALADAVIENDGSLLELEARIQELLETLETDCRVRA